MNAPKPMPPAAPPTTAWTKRRHALRLYRFLQILLAPLIRFFFLTRRRGHKTIPRKGPVILVSNHASNIDPVLVVGSVRRPVFHLGKHTLFTSRFKAWFFQTLGGQIPVDRFRGGNQAAVEAALRVLERGQALGIYPEGGRTPDGRLCRGHTGVARIALLSGAPVYPVAIAGTYRAWPKRKKLPRLFRPTKVLVGAPRVYSRDPRAADDASQLRRITDELMTDLAGLLGQPYEPRQARLLDVVET